ncbi:MAG: sulfotransferase [Pseudomonadota bacterium]
MFDVDIDKYLKALERGSYEDVHKTAIGMIQNNVRNPLPYFLLALVCVYHNNVNKALELFEKSLAYDGDNAYTLVYYAKTMSQLGNQKAAKKLLDKASRQNPQQPFLADMMGVIYSKTGFHEHAIAWFKTAVSLDSDRANFHYNLGASQQFLGHFDDAEVAYKKAINLSSGHYKALSSIVHLRKQASSDNLIDVLKVSFKEHSDDADARLHLGHALAKSYEDLGEYEESLNWLAAAKEKKRNKAATFEYTDIFQSVEQLAKTRDIKTVSKVPANEESPIFIVGLPRTGTTLVDRIISSHADVKAAGELSVFGWLLKKNADTASRFVLDKDTISASDSLDMHEIGNNYIEATRHLRQGVKRFTDKMPLNFFYADLINRALPNARIIVLRRHPMDSCLSNYRQLLTAQHNYYEYTYDLQRIANFYLAFDALVDTFSKSLPHNRFLQVSYEDLVLNQEEQTRRLLDFCELEWDDACMRFHKNTDPVSTASSVQVRQPLYSKSIGRWKRYGNRLDELFETLSQQLPLEVLDNTVKQS